MKFDIRFSLLPLLAASALVAQAAEPILIGDGKEKISATAIRDLQELARKVADKEGDVWMLHCDMYLSGSQTGHVFRVWVYFTPRIQTSRLLRGSSILCIDRTMANSWYKDSPVVGDWSSTDQEPKDYALVASPGKEFAAKGPWAKPFSVVGKVADADLIAVADIVHETLPDEELHFVRASDETHLQAHTYREPGRFLHISFEKTNSRWREIKRTALVE